MTSTPDLTIVPIETPTLGDRSYVVHDGEVAFVVDPQRDIDRVLDVLEADRVRLTHVFETHIHNDYVTGGLALAQATGAAYLVNGADEVSFDRTPIADGEEVRVGARMKVRAISTPVHTFTHLSYALTDNDEPHAVFTGGSLLFGATGRPDLLGEESSEPMGTSAYIAPEQVLGERSDPASDLFALGCLLSFVLAVSSFITPKLLGGGRVFLLATEIYDQAIVTLNWPLAATLSMIILVIFGAALVLYSRLLRAIL